MSHEAELIDALQRLTDSPLSLDAFVRVLRSSATDPRLEPAAESVLLAFAAAGRAPDLDFGRSLLEARRPDLALRFLLASGSQSAASAESLDLLGRALNNLGRLPDAIDCFEQALIIEPDSANVLLHLGHVLLRVGRLQEAMAKLGDAAQLAPDDAMIRATLGRVLTDLGHWGAACEAFRRASELEPDHRDRHLDLGLALERLGDLSAAGDAYAEAMRLAPGDPEIKVRIGLLALSEGRTTEARAELVDALALDPLRADAAAGILASYDAEGEYQAGLSWFGSSDAAWRDDPEVRIASALLKLHAGDCDGLHDELAAIGDDSRHPDSTRSLAWSLAGEASDRLGDADTAWAAWTASNGLQPARFDQQEHQRYVTKLLATPHSPLKVASAGRHRPILILGLPRSGSSLLEQMLSMHPAIAGGGERIALGKLVTRVRAALAEGDSDELATCAAIYRDDLASFAGDASHATDKMWQNFEYLDVIAALLPDAVILHLIRDPRDVALSCYAQSFGYGGVPFSYDSESIALFIERYQELMRHRSEDGDLEMIEVHYEELVASPEASIRRILAAADLEFDPSCLEPHRSDRVVTTASNAQVREAIHGGRLQRWRRYAHLLPQRWSSLSGPETS